ncbi:ciliogenesis and planar polarity effector 2 [Hydra vulgaris]|uniref:Ciliogenesis and planar polarity effector 2 n=1 Tax=Hydra vulgaris TaxID=6087 RepID=A0ABM4BLD8_HYDVU
MQFGSLIDFNIFSSSSVKEFLSPLVKKGNRKYFGLLESPLNYGAAEKLYATELQYKIFVCGNGAIGKTSAILKLSGQKIPDNIPETLGIQTTVVYWPVRLLDTDQYVLFKLMFFDTSEQTLNTYNHILPSCTENLDCVVYMFSFSRYTTWEDIPKLISRVDVGEDVLKVCAGIQNADIFSKKTEITNKMIKDFEQVWGFPVLNINNENKEDCKILELFEEISTFMNKLCELLWYRDQVRANLIPKNQVNFCFKDNLNMSDNQNRADEAFC